ncbi:thioredoxin domain-containing protein [Arsenicicoccus dermatophilus]|uniref:thioredoxin domain-containing protein n=1 Tax=Arsenicicoccus dermatophilus TaxID=1076331 RepID=UPI0039176349
MRTPCPRPSTSRALAGGVLAVAVSAGLVPTAVAAPHDTTCPASARPSALAVQAGAAHRPATALRADQSVIDVDASNLAQVKEMARTKPVVFVVTAPSWCGYCKKLDPVIRRYNADDKGAWILAIIDVDKAGGAEKEFGVDGYPTMVPFGRSGEMQDPGRMAGWAGESGTREWVSSVTKAYGPGDDPTAEPTAAPTDGPTDEPTSAPSDEPTSAPTDGPTAAPTDSPSDGTLPALPPGAVQLTDQNFEEAVMAESKKRTVVIDFSKDKCDPCLKIAPVLDEKYRKDAGKWQYTRLDGTQFPQLWKKYDNPWFPTLVAVKDGKELARRSGFEGDTQQVTDWLDKVAQGEAPASDPAVVELKDAAAWDQITAISKRHPVAVRAHRDGSDQASAEQGKVAAEMVNGDGGKWTLANVDLEDEDAASLLEEHGVEVTDAPKMVVFYNGKIQDLAALEGPSTKEQLRSWVDTMLSTHYPTLALR